MEWQTILWILVILVLLYFIFTYITKERDMLNAQITAGNVMTMINPSSSGENSMNSSNFTYSMWFYINDWNYRYGEQKIIMGRSGTAIASESMTTAGDASTSTGTIGTNMNNPQDLSSLQPCPFVVLGGKENNLTIALTCYTNASTNSQGIVHYLEIANVPIQKWVNLFFSVYGRTLDVYIDGKLVRTGILPGTAKITPTANIYLTPNGGFNGWTSKLQYWNNASNPQMAWDTYMKGYGAGLFSNLFGKYKVKVALLTDNQEKAQFTL
jgi:hypothetical protein